MCIRDSGKIDPLIGREFEVERTIQILCRRRKNNPLLVGDPGVGKPAIAEGLAQKIVDGEAPSILADAVTTHHGHMPEIEMTSPTTATGVWALEDQPWWPEGGPLKHMHGFGHYHETYEKGDDRWRIKTMTITRLHRLVEA